MSMTYAEGDILMVRFGANGQRRARVVRSGPEKPEPPFGDCAAVVLWIESRSAWTRHPKPISLYEVLRRA